MKSVDRELGLRQLASMLKSGLPLLAALETTADQSPRGPSRVWRGVAAAVSEGVGFSEALAATRSFDAYVLALVRVGEETGELDRVLATAADHTERRRLHRAMVLNALFYPVLVVMMTVAVVGFMMVKVIPALKLFMEAQRQRLPEITVVLMDVSDCVCANAPRWGLALAVALVALVALRRHPVCREATDAALFRIPVVGRILRLSATAVFARSLSMLLESGVTLLAALESVRMLFANARIVRRIREAHENVMRGGTLSEALAASPEFMPMLARMANVGETAGTLGTTLEEVAAFHEGLLAAAIRRFGMVLEPLMIVLVGTIVGFVYIAFFMAVFSLAGGK